MRVGVIGLGKVGLPLALLLAGRPFQRVTGLDLDLLHVRVRLADAEDRDERGLGEAIRAYRDRVALTESYAGVAESCDVVLVAVQTPHPPGYGGDEPAPTDPRDFDYTYLRDALSALVDETRSVGRTRALTVGIVSTVLLGATRRELLPLVEDTCVRLAYCPVFISLGDVVRGLVDPPLALVGADDGEAADDVLSVMRTLWHGLISPVRTSIESAELAKVAYNCWLTQRISFINSLAALCDADGLADVDEVTRALRAVEQPPFPRAGMGDGGACRPRDLIAMSCLTERLLDRLSAELDPFLDVAAQRDAHASWLAHVVCSEAKARGLRSVVLGRAYKPNVSYTYGSPAGLAAHYVEALSGEPPERWDPLVDGDRTFDEPSAFLVGTDHPRFAELRLPAGSVVVDPWGSQPPRNGVDLVRPGRRPL